MKTTEPTDIDETEDRKGRVMAWWKYARPGQKVVELSRAETRCTCPAMLIHNGIPCAVDEVLTVEGILPYPPGCTGFAVKIVELENPYGCCPAGFEIIQDTKTQVEALKRATIRQEEKA